MPGTPAPDPALAAAIRGLRGARGITQEALAHDANITAGTLSRIELGTTTPSWSTVRALCQALGVTLTELAQAVEGAGG